MSEAILESPQVSAGIKSKVLSILPRGLKDQYRAFREGVSFPFAHQVEVGGVTANFWVENFKERTRLNNLGNERKELTGVLNTLHDGDVFLDVGSHIGTYSVFAARKGCSTIAVEPDPSIFKRLNKNIEINLLTEKVLPQNCAAGRKDARMPLFSGGIDTMSPSVGVNVHDLKSTGSVEVKTIDEIIRPLVESGKVNSWPSVIKIDVEGMEQDVIDGMNDTLSTGRPRDIFIEIHYELLKKRGQDAQNLFDHLKSVGYEPTKNEPSRFGERSIFHFSRSLV